MGKIILPVILIVTVLTITTHAANTATFICSKDAISVTSAVVDTFVPARIFAKGKSASCSSGITATTNEIAFTGDGKAAATKYVGIIPKASYTDCGVVETAAAGGNPAKREITIFVTKSTSIIQKGDVFFKITCTGDVSIEAEATVTSVTGDADVEVTPTADGSYAIKLVAAADTAATKTALTSTTVGTSVKVEAILSNTDKTGGLATCQLLTLVAAPDNTYAKTVPLITAGCTDNADKIFADKSGKPTYTVDAGAKTATALTGAFNMFRYFTGNQVVFKASCKGCLTGDTSCTTVTCPPTGRKRRDVTARNETVLPAQTLVFIVDKANAGKQAAQDTTFTSCLNHVSFIAVVAILALLLLISLAVSVFFCSKLLRQKEQGTGMQSYPNQGYKA